jgi:hypothetical protein
MPFLVPMIAATAFAIEGAAIIGISASTFAWGVVTVGSIGISLGSQLLISKLKSTTAPQAASASGPAGVQTSVQFGGAVPRSAVYGKQATAGHLLYWNVYGSDNQYLQFVYALGDGLHDGLDGMFVDGKAVTFGTVTPGADTPVTEYARDGIDHLWFRFFNGEEDQIADTRLVDNANPAGRWTTDHKLSGICYVSVTMKYNETVFTNGVPTFLFVPRGLRLYDPRLDSTNGGSGTHRWNVPSTYEWSENPAICLYNYQRGLFLGDELILGQGVAPFDLLTDMYVAAANVCDEAVPLLAGGTELRYRVGEQITADRQHRDVIQDFLAAMAGQLLETAGAFGPLAGAAQTSVMTITDTDLVVGQSRTYSSHRSRDELINTISGSYSDPSQNWQPVPYPMRTSSADESTDGERLGVQRDYPQINSGTQVQRVAEIERRLARTQGTATEVLPFKYSVLESGDWITRVSTRFGYTKIFQVVTARVEKDQSVAVTLREISADVYAWDEGVDELDPQVPGDLPGYGDPITTVSGFDLEAITLPGQGGVIQPAIRAIWSPVADRTVTDVLVEYRLVDQPDDVSTAPLFRPANGYGTISDGIQGGETEYEARATIITQPARTTTWTAWTPITGPLFHVVRRAEESLTTRLASFEAGLKARVTTEFKVAQDRIDEALKILSSVVTERDLTSYTDKKELRNRIASTTDDLTASIETVSTVATNAQSALATLETTVTAATGSGLSASVISTYAASASLSGDVGAMASLQLNVNGKITGYQIISGAVTSTFDIETDYFRVGKSGVTGGAFQTVFQISTVSGSPAMVLKGDFIADGDITTRMLTAGIINTVTLIADNLIVAGKVVLDNMTKTTVGSNGGGVTVSYSGSAQTLLTTSFVSSGYKTTFQVSISVAGNIGSVVSQVNFWDVGVAVNVDGSQQGPLLRLVARVANTTTNTVEMTGTFSITVATTPSAGSHSLTLTCTPATDAGGHSFSIPSGGIVATITEGLRAS